MQVRIAFVTGPDGQIDVNRVGTIEDHPEPEARRLIAAGIAAEPTEQELADWDIERQRRDEARTAELSELKKAELLEQVPDGVDVPRGATKEDLVAAIVEAEHAPPAGATSEAVADSEGPIVTAAPGSMAGDSAGPGDNVDGTGIDAGTATADADAGTTASRTSRRR